MIDRFVDLLIAWRYGCFALAAALLVLAWPAAEQLQFDRRVEQMFPERDPAVAAYDQLRERFGGNAVAMLVFRNPRLMTPEGIAQLDDLSAAAEQIPGVIGALTLAQVDQALERATPQRLFGFSDQPAILQETTLAQGFRQLFAEYTHDASGTWAALVTILDPTRPDQHAAAIRQLRELADQLPADQQPVALVGEPVLVAEGFALVDADGRRLATTTLILLGLTTGLLFRSPRWVVAELIVIIWSVQMTRALSAWLGLQLTMVSSMLTAIVTVIAVASIIHVAMRFATRRGRGDDPREATRRTLTLVLPPIFWACLTDAAGFAALTISEVGPVRDFGRMMAIGGGMVMVAVVLLVPLIMLIPAKRFHTHRIPGDRAMRRALVRSVICLSRHRRAVGIVSLLLSVLTGWGINRLQTETNFIRNFRSTSQLARAYATVETEFGGAGVWDVLLPAPDNLTDGYLSSVRSLEQKLRRLRVPSEPNTPAIPTPGRGEATSSEVALTKVLSMAGADAVASQSPLLALASPGVRIGGMRAAMPAFADALLTPASQDQPRMLRIMLRSPERISANGKMRLIDAVTREVQTHTSSSEWRALFSGEEDQQRTPAELQGQVTGYYVLLARLIDSLLSDQWWCLLLAGVAVTVMIAIAFRSALLAAICMVPNLLPVLAVLGALGLTGTRVNMGAAMIAAVSLGLTIDGSIHFVSTCQAARRRGASPRRAVWHAQRRVGLPVVVATIALALGFSVLATSTFIPTVTFGVLVTAALLAGTLANLTLLPLLLIENPPTRITR